MKKPKPKIDVRRRIETHIRAILSPRNAESRMQAVKNAFLSGKKFISNTKRVITIGGGTGTFIVLSALKSISDVSLSAIVSVADDGGSTGRLRDAYGFLPHGDARQALVALSKEGTMLRDVFAYRFAKGDVKGHNLGNLLLTALTDRLGSDGAAIRAASEILNVRGYVVPVSEFPGTLIATLENGDRVVGQHAINARPPGGSPIRDISIQENISLADEANLAIESANLIILGPGDLYTSTLANFAVPGLKEAVAKAGGNILYFVNLFSTAAETAGYSARKHVETIEKYTGRKPDYVVVHTGALPADVLAYYAGKQAFPVTDDLGDDPSVIRGSFAETVFLPKIEGDEIERSLIRHDPAKVREIVRKLL
ncbi:MAG: YvcK family protein [Patescibacteria group bacterium]|nr:YvcK family protein [Patescibacteria group bacterium]